MEELVVTRFWMAGVMAIMVLFGAISIAGIVVKTKRDAATSESENEVSQQHDSQ